MAKARVCMISCLHPLQDDRIYWKEAISLQKAGFEVVHLGVSHEAYDKTTEHGIRLISIKRKTYFANPYLDKIFRTLTLRKSIYKELFKIASGLKANVYHFHDIQLNRIGPKLKKLPHKPKVVFDVHEPFPITLSTIQSRNAIKHLLFKIYGKYMGKWELRKSRHYDLIIPTEENVANYFKAIFPNKPVEIIYNYTDLNNEGNITEKTYDFIYCGGIRERRGFWQILEAVKIIKDKGVELKVLFIGHIHDLGLKEKAKAYIEQNNISCNIEIKSNVPYEEVPDYYKKSKCGLAIFNNIEVNRTIMPIKLFEYIVFELPVIASNFGHLKNVTEKNKSGIAVDPNNIEEVVKAIELCLNETKYNELKTNCKKASRNYRWSIMDEKLKKIYLELIN